MAAPASGPAIRVEVAHAEPSQQLLVTVRLDRDATVADALAAACQAEASFPEVPADADVGVWGVVSRRDAPLQNGDRVEIYRPLKLDPREARRRFAAAGMTMASHAGEPPAD